jgi:hypothetical protein
MTSDKIEKQYNKAVITKRKLEECSLKRHHYCVILEGIIRYLEFYRIDSMFEYDDLCSGDDDEAEWG